jgi:cobalt-zinc-cadmium efflux system membrane fusion protein
MPVRRHPVTPHPFRLIRLAPWLAGLPLVAVTLLTGCKEAPPPVAEVPAPMVQNRQLRFPPGHPQLELLAVSTAAAGQTVPVEMPARLVWNEAQTQRIYPAFAGRVARILADVGDTVRAGGVLAELASPDFGAAQADTAKARVDLATAQKAVERQRELFEAGIVARKDLEQAEADVGRAQAEAARAQSRTQLYGGSAAVNQQLALRTTLGGVVVERNLNPGQELRPDASGPGTPALFVVTDPGSLWVQIDARESEVGTLRPGSTFALIVPSLPGEVFEGRVTAVADFIDPGTRTVRVRGLVANPQRRLKAEMLATARVERTLGAGVAIPASAVMLGPTGHYVFLRTQPGVFEPRDVKLGYQGAAQVIVSSGLEVGDAVVSTNTLLLARQFRLADDQPSPAVANGGTKAAS